ncbi:hypothetical protein ACFL6C_05785 [Myxococcota bacterium]
MASNNKDKTAKAVYVIREGGNGDNFWIRVGIAFTNRDGSLNVSTSATSRSARPARRVPSPHPTGGGFWC